MIETPAAAADPRGIQLRDVSFTCPGKDQPALAGINLTIRRDEVIALVGENGSGTPTLSKLITGLYPPTEGTVRWVAARSRSDVYHRVR